MNGVAVIGAHASTNASLQGSVQRSALSATPDAHADREQGARQSAFDDTSADTFTLVDDDDVDDEPILSVAVRAWLHYLPSAVPQSASFAACLAPAASLLRPPRLA